MNRPQPGEITLLPQPGRMRQAAVMGVISVVLVAAAMFIGGNLATGLMAGALVMAVSGVRAARSGVRCDAKGVGVQGLTLTHRFTWTEIAKFENRHDQGIGVELKQSGGWIRLVGPRVFGERSEATTSQLERERMLHQSL